MNVEKELADIINALNKQYMVKRILVETAQSGTIIFNIQVPFMFKMLYGKSYIKHIDKVVEEKSKNTDKYLPILISTVF